MENKLQFMTNGAMKSLIASKQSLNAHLKSPEELEKWAEEKAKQDAENFNTAMKEAKDGIECGNCFNKEWIMDYHFASVGYWSTYVRPCPCTTKRKSMRDKKRSGLNASGKYTFDNYRTQYEWQKGIKEQALAFLDDVEDGGWFFIGGQSGAGKTHICTAIADACIAQGRKAKYMIWSEEYNRLKGLIASDPEKYQAEMKHLTSVPVLLIDDLFKGGKNENGKFRPPTEADIKGAFGIINARYNNPRSITIISSERMLNEICDLDNAIGGRIAERAGDYIINLPANNSFNYRINRKVQY